MKKSQSIKCRFIDDDDEGDDDGENKRNGNNSTDISIPMRAHTAQVHAGLPDAGVQFEYSNQLCRIRPHEILLDGNISREIPNYTY